MDNYAVISSSFSNIASSSKVVSGAANSNVGSFTRERRVWKLMSMLHRQNLLLYTPPTPSLVEAAAVSPTTDSVLPPLLPLEATPSNVLEQLYTSSTPVGSLLRRRSLILKWLQNCCVTDGGGGGGDTPSPSNHIINDPPKMGGSDSRHFNSDIDHYQQNNNNYNNNNNNNNENEEAYHTEVLSAVWYHLRRGDIDGACQICQRHDQSWRIPTLRGGSLITKDNNEKKLIQHEPYGNVPVLI